MSVDAQPDVAGATRAAPLRAGLTEESWRTLAEVIGLAAQGRDTEADPLCDRMQDLLDEVEGWFEWSSMASARLVARADAQEASYAEYLKSPAWQALRRQTLVRDGFRCLACGARTGLHVHHLTYERRGHEHLDDLLTLCGDCHAVWHGKAPR